MCQISRAKAENPNPKFKSQSRILYQHKMGKKCSVPNCKSGYATNTSKTKISFHSFPPDPDLRNVWKINVGRPNWEPTPHSSVCSLHFRESDYKLKSTDSQVGYRISNYGIQNKLDFIKKISML